MGKLQVAKVDHFLVTLSCFHDSDSFIIDDRGKNIDLVVGDSSEENLCLIHVSTIAKWHENMATATTIPSQYKGSKGVRQ